MEIEKLKIEKLMAQDEVDLHLSCAVKKEMRKEGVSEISALSSEAIARIAKKCHLEEMAAQKTPDAYGQVRVIIDRLENCQKLDASIGDGLDPIEVITSKAEDYEVAHNHNADIRQICIDELKDIDLKSAYNTALFIGDKYTANFCRDHM